MSAAEALAPEQSVDEVRESLSVTEKGQPANTIGNCRTVFCHDPLLRDAIRLNRLTDRVDIVRDLGWRRNTSALTDTDVKYLLLYFEQNYGLTSEKKMTAALSIVANENCYHPIQDVLNGLVWDGTPRIRSCLHHFLGADESDYVEEMLKHFLLGAIRRGVLGLNTKEMLVPECADAMMKLKPGQVSGVVETDYGFHLIQLIEKIGSQYHARHILLKPQYTDMDMEEPYNVLDSVQRQIVDGTITFEEAAMRYSQDKYSKQNGGLASNLEQLEIMNYGDPTEASVKFYKDYLNPDDFRALEKLEIDGVSKPYTTQDYRQRTLCKVVKLKEVIPAHPANIKEDYVQLEKLALAVKQEREFVRWLKSKVDGMYIRIDEDFKDCEFEHSFLLK